MISQLSLETISQKKLFHRSEDLFMNGYDEWKTGNYGEDYFPDEKPVYTCDICG